MLGAAGYHVIPASVMALAVIVTDPIDKKSTIAQTGQKGRNKMFDPMTDVPMNEKQAIIALRHGKSGDVANSLVGIFQCRLALGDGLLAAYEKALLAHIAAAKRLS